METKIRLNVDKFDIEWDDDFVDGNVEGRDLVITTARGDDVHNSLETQVVFHDFDIKHWEKLIEVSNEAIESIKREAIRIEAIRGKKSGS